MDQGLLEETENGEKYFSYGGDYGPAGTPSDNNFLCNGLIFPDRTIHPSLYEVKKVYQNLRFEFDWDNKDLFLNNGYVFSDLSDVELHWRLLLNGEIVDEGVYESIKTDPGGIKRILSLIHI